MIRAPRESLAGLTLVEVLISSVLMAMVLGVPLLALARGTGAFETGSKASSIEARGWRAIDRVAGLMRGADAAGVLPPAVVVPFPVDSMDFQRATGWAGGSATLGPLERIAFEYGAEDPDDGLDNDGDGFVDEGMLVWTTNPGAANEQRVVLCGDVAEWGGGEIPGNLADDDGNGLTDERGFALAFDGPELVIALTLQQRDAEGYRHARTYMRSVRPRN